MYQQLNILLCVCIYVSSSLAINSSQQCPHHLTPFAETTCALEVTPIADQSSILFPQASDLDLLVRHNTEYNEQQDNYQGQSIVYNSSPSSPHSPVHSTTLPPTIMTPTTNNNNSDRRVTIPSFEEWKKRIRQTEETDNNPKPKRKSTRGTASQGRETIDSVDGGFSDDVGSVFDSSDPNGPVSISENTYEEGEYIAPQKQQQQQRQANKKHFAQVPLKSLKERFNYAWTICAATVRDVNKEARGAQSILFESKDQYLLNKCSADKFVIINLCEEILIDTIVLANFEFFSSTFKDFRVYVANTYPTKDWQLLGQWQAKNTRDLQVFKVQDSIGWFEYIKIEFLTHYGHEYYCPLSLVRVHGMPMMEYYNAVESQGLSGDEEIETLGDQHLWPADLRDDIIHPQLVTNTSEWFPSKGDTDLEDDNNDQAALDGKLLETIVPEHQDNRLENATDSNSNNDQQLLHTATNPDPPKTDFNSQTTINDIDPKSTLISDENKTTSIEHEASSTSPSTDTVLHNDSDEDISDRTSHSIEPTTTSFPDVLSSAIDSHLDQQRSPTTTVDIPSTTDSVTAPSESPTTDTIEHFDTTSKQSPEGSPSTSLESAVESASATTITPLATPPTEDNRPKSIPNAHNKEPATQESIYKIIMKRLNALEANATLSQRYLDEQNNMLNDVFTEMEKRHQDQLILVLDRLNETASSRIDSMKRRYEQSYGELKQQMETDMREMTAKISILTDQISFEKRISMAQLAIVVTLFVFLALSRGTMSTLSPVMMAQAEERKRRESDATRSAADGKKRTRLTLKSKLDTSNKIKLGMEGRKAASLDALKLHLAQQADLLPKIPSQPLQSQPQKPIPSPPEKPPPSSSQEPPIALTDPKQEGARNGRSISLDDITNTHDNGQSMVKLEQGSNEPVDRRPLENTSDDGNRLESSRSGSDLEMNDNSLESPHPPSSSHSPQQELKGETNP